MQLAVCDDNQLFLKEIDTQLRELPIVDSVELFANLELFRRYIVEKGRRYHAVLLDIDWGRQETGLDIAQRLYLKCPETQIIYVTGYNDLFSQQILLYKANLTGYLTKPIDPDLLQRNLQKVLDGLPLRDEPVLVVSPNGNPLSIPLREIFYLESRRHTLLIHTEKGVVTVYQQLSAVLRDLPAEYVQCHKSFAVNLRKIQRFQPGSVLLKCGALVPVSRTRYADTKSAYFQLMGTSF